MEGKTPGPPDFAGEADEEDLEGGRLGGPVPDQRLAKRRGTVSGIRDLLWKELPGRHFFSMNGGSESEGGGDHHHNHGNPPPRRIVSKKGIVHTERTRVSKRKRRYIADFFNTMLDIKWRYVLLIFTLSFFLR